MGALYHAASRSVYRSVLVQVNRFLHSVRLTRFAATALRVALAAGFLSAVADRFGLWGMPGTPGVARGDWSHFLTYTGRLNWFLPDSLKKAGIGYVHMPGLGGLRHAKSDSLNTSWRNASFRGYAD